MKFTPIGVLLVFPGHKLEESAVDGVHCRHRGPVLREQLMQGAPSLQLSLHCVALLAVPSLVVISSPLTLQELILKMLTRDPTKRPTADQVLYHPWVQSARGSLPHLLDLQEHVEDAEPAPPTTLPSLPTHDDAPFSTPHPLKTFSSGSLADDAAQTVMERVPFAADPPLTGATPIVPTVLEALPEPHGHHLAPLEPLPHTSGAARLSSANPGGLDALGVGDVLGVVAASLHSTLTLHECSSPAPLGTPVLDRERPSSPLLPITSKSDLNAPTTDIGGDLFGAGGVSGNRRRRASALGGRQLRPLKTKATMSPGAEANMDSTSNLLTVIGPHDPMFAEAGIPHAHSSHAAPHTVGHTHLLATPDVDPTNDGVVLKQPHALLKNPSRRSSLPELDRISAIRKLDDDAGVASDGDTVERKHGK